MFPFPGKKVFEICFDYIQVQLDHDSGVTSMSLDDDCELLVTGTKDGQICVWEMHDIYSACLHSMHQSKFAHFNKQHKLQMKFLNPQSLDYKIAPFF